MSGELGSCVDGQGFSIIEAVLSADECDRLRLALAGLGPYAPAWALERIVALRIHLDASTGENGPPRVIPGSHRSGVLTDEAVLLAARRRASVECLVGRGGVLAMRPLLIHASSKVKRDLPRRVIHIEYADGLNFGRGVKLVIA